MSKKYHERLARSSGFSKKEFSSDFGLKVLKKFGWEEGKGLGRNEDGRKECIQQERREVNAGLGTEAKGDTEKQWDNWWSDCFNSAAKRIAEKSKSGIIAEPEEDSDSDDDAPVAEVHKVASKEGGRATAIKSASRMAGKLKRVLRQEKPKEEEREDAAKKTKTPRSSDDEEADETDTAPSTKKKPKKRKSPDMTPEGSPEVSEEDGEMSEPATKKKKKKHRENSEDAASPEDTASLAEAKKLRKQKKKEAKMNADDTFDEEVMASPEMA